MRWVLSFLSLSLVPRCQQAINFYFHCLSTQKLSPEAISDKTLCQTNAYFHDQTGPNYVSDKRLSFWSNGLKLKEKNVWKCVFSWSDWLNFSPYIVLDSSIPWLFMRKIEMRMVNNFRWDFCTKAKGAKIDLLVVEVTKANLEQITAFMI